MAESRIPAEHLDILQKSGLLNPDLTLEKIVGAATELDKSFAALGAAKSVPTLIGLCILAFVLYIFQGLLEALRSRILARIGAALDESLSGRVFDIVVRAPLKGAAPGDGLLPLRDLDQLRAFLGGSGPSAFFDLPWMPIYLLICFLFHPLIGVAALVPGRPPADPGLLVRAADQALYAAKSAGRDAVRSAGQLAGPDPAPCWPRLVHPAGPSSGPSPGSRSG